MAPWGEWHPGVGGTLESVAPLSATKSTYGNSRVVVAMEVMMAAVVVVEVVQVRRGMSPLHRKYLTFRNPKAVVVAVPVVAVVQRKWWHPGVSGTQQSVAPWSEWHPRISCTLE